MSDVSTQGKGNGIVDANAADGLVMVVVVDVMRMSSTGEPTIVETKET